jgi:hypothetical protein
VELATVLAGLGLLFFVYAAFGFYFRRRPRLEVRPGMSRTQRTGAVMAEARRDAYRQMAKPTAVLGVALEVGALVAAVWHLTHS